MRMSPLLTGSELDRGQIEIGMLVEVVHGKGPRHRFSGEWAEVATVRGVIEAVNWERRQLVVAREGDGRKETIAVDRIQTMMVIDHTAPGNSLMVQEMNPPLDIENKVDNRDSLRIGKKIAAGVLGGVAGGFVGAAIARNMERRAWSEPEPGTDPSASYAIGALVANIKGFCIGSMFGAVISMSLVDRQDNLRITFGHSLTGSVVGLLGGIGLTTASKGALWPSLFVGPVALATAWSERSRKRPESRRVSFGLVPTPQGGLSAIATLRF